MRFLERFVNGKQRAMAEAVPRDGTLRPEYDLGRQDEREAALKAIDEEIEGYEGLPSLGATSGQQFILSQAVVEGLRIARNIILHLNGQSETGDKSASDENEACALIADTLAAQWDDEGAIQGACIVADAIRARRKR